MRVLPAICSVVALVLVAFGCQSKPSVPESQPTTDAPQLTATSAVPPAAASVSTPTLSASPDDEIDESYSRRTPFVPLDNPVMLGAEENSYVGDDELVLGLSFEGEARAYPIQMLTFHHIVNDTVAGSPLLVTY